MFKKFNFHDYGSSCLGARAPVLSTSALLVKRVALTTDAQSIYESSEVSTKSLRKRRLTAISVATINSIGISSFDDHKHQTTVRERPKGQRISSNKSKDFESKYPIKKRGSDLSVYELRAKEFPSFQGQVN